MFPPAASGMQIAGEFQHEFDQMICGKPKETRVTHYAYNPWYKKRGALHWFLDQSNFSAFSPTKRFIDRLFVVK